MGRQATETTTYTAVLLSEILKWRSFYTFKDNLVEVWILSSQNAATDFFMPEIKIKWFMEQTSPSVSNPYSLLDAS